MIKIFAPETARSSDQQFFNPILEAFWNDLDETERMMRFGSCITAYKLVSQPQDADFYLLPLVWNYYIDHDCIQSAGLIYEDAIRYHKPLVIVSRGDYTAHVPFQNVIIIQSCAYRSRNRFNGQRLLAIPSFISDYVRVYGNGEISIRDKGQKPKIGFCGQASGTLLDFSRRQSYIWMRQIQYKLGMIRWEPPPLESTRFRNSILKRLYKSNSIEKNIIARSRYRAGYLVKEKDPFHPTRLEFVNNILNTDYTLCVRGGGNFSVRFYETLSLGRIPVFIDTDCILPFDDLIDYRKYCVWIDSSEIPFITEKVAEFHNALSSEGFKELQHACRDLWSSYLEKDSFLSKLGLYINSKL